jgi:nucleotide-binding universal stress UspA family protein
VPPLALAKELGSAVVAEVMRTEIAHGKQVLDRLAHDLGPAHFPITKLELEGPAALRIAEVAETHGYDLVIVGARGKNAGGRVILGSVADRLVHICLKPVLVVR